MKKLLLPAILAGLLAGCGILPKKVEYFQHKVKPVPEATETAKEHQRQAAQFVAVKAAQVEKVAISEGATNIIVPAAEASGAAQALSQSLGPAETPWTKSSTNLVQTLQKDQAKLNARIEDYRQDVQQDVGKKIEGTGLFQIGYFTQWGIVLGILALLWTALKIYGLVNPAVGLGTNLVGRIGSSILSRGLSEVVAGGERFKAYLESSAVTAEVKAYVQDLFQRAHMEAQSQDVQAIVTDLTRKAEATAPSGAPVPAPKS